MAGIDRTPARRAPPLRAPVAAVNERAAAANRMPSASVSSLLSGKALYTLRDGRLIELPDGMTAQQAAELEADAVAATQRLGKGPPPKPVPDIRKPADKSAQPSRAKAAAGARPAAAGGRSVPRSAGRKARLQPVGGQVAQFLLAKAAPVLGKGIAMLGQLSRNEQTHDNAARKTHQAELAVVVPASDGQSKSNLAQVGAIGARPAPPVDPARGRQMLKLSLADNVPRRIEDVDNFKRDRKAGHIGADVMGVVQGDKNAVVATYAELEKTPPAAPPEHAPEALPPPEPAPATAALGLGRGAVAPLEPAHTDTSAFTNQADARLREEGVTQEQLDMVDSGDLAAANQEKKGLEQIARSEPKAIQSFAREQSQQVDKALAADEKAGRAQASGRRRAGLAGSAKKQQHAKSALEKKRDEVAARINALHAAAQKRVTKQLADLDTVSMKRFDEGNARATQAFEDQVQRDLEAYKDDRYSGVFGWARKARDWLLGMDDLPGVKAIFERNRAAFVAAVDALVAAIAADNARVVQGCKDDLAQTRRDIQAFVDTLGPALKDIGNKTAGEVGRQLDDMDGFVRKQEEALQHKLADKQQAAIKAIDEKIEKMKDAMSGALAKLGKLLLLAAKKLFTWALEQMGYSLADIQGIIDKGVAVLKAIFTKPIVFVKNLVRAAITGFKNFGRNFLKHLQDALFEWLTGSLQGVELPKTWDLKGIVGLALQLVGVSYRNLRRHMVTVMGAPVVAGLEESFGLVRTLVVEGPMAAWEQLQALAADLKETFVAAVKDFVKWKIVEEAIKWIVSLFVPGAGLVKAVIGIYDTIVFFIQKARQIAQMLANFLGSIAEIAAGNVGAAADAMERGLARALSLVISFLAKLLHLDGVTARIRVAVRKVHDKVDAALLKMAHWVWRKAQKVVGKVQQGAKAGLAKLANWWKRERKFIVGGEPHRVFYAGGPKNAQVRVASDEKGLEDFLADTRASSTKGKRKTAWDAASGALALIKSLRMQRKPATPDAADPVVDPQIDAQFTLIADNVPALFDHGAAWGSDSNPAQMAYPKKAASLYRALYLGPRTLGEARLKQGDLAAAFGKTPAKAAPGFDPDEHIKGTKPALDTWVASGGRVRKYLPFEQQAWPDGGSYGSSATLGLAPKFQAQVGTAFTYDKGSTPGGRKINDALKKFGYHGRKKGGELSDGDHVMEAQLVGTANADQVPNMWPLDKTENRHGDNLEKVAAVTVPDQALQFKGIAVAEKAWAKQKPKPKGKGIRLLIIKTEGMA